MTARSCRPPKDAAANSSTALGRRMTAGLKFVPRDFLLGEFEQSESQARVAATERALMRW